MKRRSIVLVMFLLSALLITGCQTASVYSKMWITSIEGAGIKSIYCRIPKDHLHPEEKQKSGDVNSALFPKGFKPVAEFLAEIAPSDSVVNFTEEDDYWVYTLTYRFRDIDDYNKKTREMIRDDLYIFNNLEPATLTVEELEGGYEVTFAEQIDILLQSVITYVTEVYCRVDIFELSRGGKGANYPINAVRADRVEVSIGGEKSVATPKERYVTATGFIPMERSSVAEDPSLLPELPPLTEWPSPYEWSEVEPYWPTVKYESEKLDYTFAVFPDTQAWTEYFPQVFERNARWIAENAEEENIKFVMHVGDITDDNIPIQWYRAKRSLSMLDGVVPYALAIGNHDYPSKPMTRDSSLFNRFFPITEYEGLPTFGGAFEEGKMDNVYHIFRAGSHDYLILALEFGPRDEVLDWANEVISQHPEHRVIILTHAYLYRTRMRMYASTFTSPNTYPLANVPGESVNNGESIWHKVASRHKNVFMVISGHVHEPENPKNLIYSIDTGVHGNKVIQLLADAKGFENNIFLIRISEDGKRIGIENFSPFHNAHTREGRQEIIEYGE